MIYGFGPEHVVIVRRATLADVEKFDRRTPRRRERHTIGAYVVVRRPDGTEELYRRDFLRADEGMPEIDRAIEALDRGAKKGAAGS